MSRTATATKLSRLFCILAVSVGQLMTGNQEPSGTVRIAAMADFFDFFPMEWVADFLEAHPRVDVDFVLSDARADLIADRIDIAFRGGALQDSRYVGRQLLGAGNEGLVASPNYLRKKAYLIHLEIWSTMIV